MDGTKPLTDCAARRLPPSIAVWLLIAAAAAAAELEAPRLLPPVDRPHRSDGAVRPASGELSQPDGVAGVPAALPPAPSAHAIGRAARQATFRGAAGEEVFPIDLANALSLGGANDLHVRLARSRVYEAQADYLQARARWLPSLQLIVAYNNHAGRLQETEGNVLEISRSSLFAGGGIGPAGGGPLTAGAGGPPRAFVSWSLADAAFEPLVARQLVRAAGARSVVAMNDSLLAVAEAYFGLVESYGLLANASAGERAGSDLVAELEDYRETGLGATADVQRARVALASIRRAGLNAERLTRTRSAALARLLRLPPRVRLTPADEFVLPIEFVGEAPVEALIAQAVAARPEVSQQRAQQQAACYRVRQERMRPWLPSLHLGVSGGVFGGGPGASLPNADGRSDVDLVAVWQLENLGVGNVASLRRRRSQLHQTELAMLELRDRIAAEVATAAADAAGYREQALVARDAIELARLSYEQDRERARQGEAPPIEVLSSITALGAVLDEYTHAAAEHNRSQYRLMRALGAPPAPIVAPPAAGELTQPPIVDPY